MLDWVLPSNKHGFDPALKLWSLNFYFLVLVYSTCYIIFLCVHLSRFISLFTYRCLFGVVSAFFLITITKIATLKTIVYVFLDTIPQWYDDKTSPNNRKKFMSVIQLNIQLTLMFYSLKCCPLLTPLQVLDIMVPQYLFWINIGTCLVYKYIGT